MNESVSVDSIVSTDLANDICKSYHNSASTAFNSLECWGV